MHSRLLLSGASHRNAAVALATHCLFRAASSVSCGSERGDITRWISTAPHTSRAHEQRARDPLSPNSPPSSVARCARDRSGRSAGIAGGVFLTDRRRRRRWCPGGTGDVAKSYSAFRAERCAGAREEMEDVRAGERFRARVFLDRSRVTESIRAELMRAREDLYSGCAPVRVI